MCYIMIAKQFGESHQLTENKIREILREKVGQNPDGFFIKQDGREIRTLSKTITLEHINTVPISNLFVHFRWASAGIMSEGNVHGWTNGAWQFFHNGSVLNYVYENVKQKDTDSKILFDAIALGLSKVNDRKDKNVASVIKKCTNEAYFTGRAALYNTQTDKLYLFGDFNIYYINNYLIISSSSLDLGDSIRHRELGFEFYYPSDLVVGSTITEDIGVIYNFSKPSFEYRFLEELNEPYKPSLTQSPQPTHINTCLPKVYPSPTTVFWNAAEEDKILILEELQEKFGYIGIDKDTGVELYMDARGIHDIYDVCCVEGRCRESYKGVQIQNLEYLNSSLNMLEEEQLEIELNK